MNADAVAALRALFEDITFADRDAICVNCGSGWGEHTNACPVTVFRAALADASDAPLDVAWAKVQAALPMAGWLDPLDGRWVIPTGTWSIDIRHAESGDGYFEPAVEGYWATAKIESSSRPFAMRGDLGTTPAEALLALAATLDHREQPYGTQEYPKADTMHEELES